MAKSRRTRRKSVTPAAETRHKEEGAFSTAATAIAEEGGAASLLATFSTLKQQFAQVEASNRLLRTKWNLDEPPSAPCVSEDGLLDAMQWTVADPSPKRVVSRNFDSSSFFKRHAPQEPKLHFPYAINRAAMDALAPAHHAHVAFTGLALVNTDNDEEEATNLTPPSTSYLPTTSSFNGSSRVHTPRFSSSVTGVHIARSSATCTPKSLPVSPLDSLSFNSADLTLMVKGSPLNVEGALIQCPVEGCTRIVDSKRMLSHHKHQRHCKSLSVTYLNGFTTAVSRDSDNGVLHCIYCSYSCSDRSNIQRHAKKCLRSDATTPRPITQANEAKKLNIVIIHPFSIEESKMQEDVMLVDAQDSQKIKPGPERAGFVAVAAVI